MEEEFEDTKGVIRIRISKKNRQHNGQKKMYKRTNNHLQNMHKTKDRVSRTPLKTGGEPLQSNLDMYISSTGRGYFTGADPGFVVRGDVSRRGIWGPRPQRVQGRTLVGGPGVEVPGSSGGLRNYRHLFERQF